MDVEDSRGKKEIMNPNIFLSPEEGFFGGVGQWNRNQELRCMKFEEALKHLSTDGGDGSISYSCCLYCCLVFCDY